MERGTASVPQFGFEFKWYVRLVLAATEGLHDNIAQLRRRIRDLETSLNSLHLTRTGHTHPLLALSGEDDDLKVDDHEDVGQEPQNNATDESALIRGQDGSHRIAGAFGKSWAAHVGRRCIAQQPHLIERAGRRTGYGPIIRSSSSCWRDSTLAFHTIPAHSNGPSGSSTTSPPARPHPQWTNRCILVFRRAQCSRRF
jgi:hypothetical protein